MKTLLRILWVLFALATLAVFIAFIYYAVLYIKNDHLMNHTVRNAAWFKLYHYSWDLYAKLGICMISQLLSAFISSILLLIEKSYR